MAQRRVQIMSVLIDSVIINKMFLLEKKIREQINPNYMVLFSQ